MRSVILATVLCGCMDTVEPNCGVYGTYDPEMDRCVCPDGGVVNDASTDCILPDAGPDVGAPPTCMDGVERPCSGGTDEGVCEVGTQRCVDGVWDPCEGRIEPADESCNGMDDDCDGDIDDDASCPSMDGVESSACVSSECEVVACAAGAGDCDEDFGTGCETDFLTDPSNCGMCDRACGAAEICEEGDCLPLPALTALHGSFDRGQFVAEGAGGSFVVGGRSLYRVTSDGRVASERDLMPTGPLEIRGIEVLPSGTILVAGYFSSGEVTVGEIDVAVEPGMDPVPPEPVVLDTSEGNSFLVAYSSSFELQWRRRFGVINSMYLDGRALYVVGSGTGDDLGFVHELTLDSDDRITSSETHGLGDFGGVEIAGEVDGGFAILGIALEGEGESAARFRVARFDAAWRRDWTFDAIDVTSFPIATDLSGERLVSVAVSLGGFDLGGGVVGDAETLYLLLHQRDLESGEDIVRIEPMPNFELDRESLNVVLDEDGGTIVLAHTAVWADLYESDSGSKDIVFYRFDVDLDRLWVSGVGGTGSDEPEHAIASDGDVLVLGRAPVGTDIGAEEPVSSGRFLATYRVR